MGQWVGPNGQIAAPEVQQALNSQWQTQAQQPVQQLSGGINPYQAQQIRPGQEVQSGALGIQSQAASLPKTQAESQAVTQPVPQANQQTPALETPKQKSADRAAAQNAYQKSPDVTSAQTIASTYKQATGKELFAPIDSAARSDATSALTINDYINQAKQGMQDQTLRTIMNDPTQSVLLEKMYDIRPQVAQKMFNLGQGAMTGLAAFRKLQGSTDRSLVGGGRVTGQLINYFQQANPGLGRNWADNLDLLDKAQANLDRQLNSWARTEFYDNWQQVPELQDYAQSQQQARSGQMQYAHGSGGGRPPLSSFDQ